MADESKTGILQSGRWWGKAVVAGMIGGLAMGMYEMVATLLLGGGFWAPLNMIASTFEAFRPPAEGLNPAATLTGLMLHMITSAFWGLVLALSVGILPKLFSGSGVSLATGLLYGAIVWLVMGRGIGPALNPVMSMAPPWNFFLGHLVFGLVTAWVLYAWAKNRELTLKPEKPPLTSSGGLGLRPS